MKINANASGTRTIEVTEEQLQLIKKYSLLDRLTNSLGTVNEDSLVKLRLTVRSLIASQEMDAKELLDLCPVLYDENMKALGLANLMNCYNRWLQKKNEEQQAEENKDA
ncbi:MAG: hypothetical protein E7087_02340 [Bacteroidales bacterium]|nr:hypothetical protein [Bacteroidales bacterium]MBO5264152.1 hypothetical protein [Bacteroidaceae bacterium]